MTDYLLGADLGQSQDYSALSVLRRRWRGAEPIPVLTRKESTDRMLRGRGVAARLAEMTPERWPLYHEVRKLIRWPLGTPYPRIVKDICEIYALVESQCEMGIKLIVDAGGPGRPVIDLLRMKRLKPIGVTITAGDQAALRQDSTYTCPKRDICSALVVAAQGGDLKVAKAIELASEFEKEVEAFGYTINRKTGTMGYESVVNNVHDDLVIAVALPLWYSTMVLSKQYPIHGERTSENVLDYNPLARKTQRA